MYVFLLSWFWRPEASQQGANRAVVSQKLWVAIYSMSFSWLLVWLARLAAP